ncbi:MAG: SCO family protein [Candidatus Marinimicrobia bacterium]|nr:SCO family protein [Candidatus Neomarinimicrobiota bacterium]|tara:strand:+ start:1101 stop:1688 length:588 start_codon:yes stop_codon:yes gene_type:complete
MNRMIYFIMGAVILLGAGASWVIQKANSSYDIPILKPVPVFSFINQDGDPFTEKDLNDKITVLDFIFTSCPGPCPIMTQNMTGLYQDFDQVEEVQFVSITVDPDVDTQEILKQYAKINGVKDDRWQFITSSIEAIKDLKKNGFMLYAEELPRGHAIKFVLIDQNGQIRKYFDGTEEASMAVLRKDITNLVKEFKS